jgi:predicted kinase
MTKLHLTRPTLIMLYGFPGAGKSFFGRQLADEIGAAHVQGDRIRYELFEQPRYDRQENEIISHLMDYMSEEFLRSGISVVYDTNAARLSQRRSLRDMARKMKGQHVLIWLQIDVESAFTRVVKRDRRKADDRYAMPLDRTTFEQIIGQMQNPTQTEDYIVISGKHTFQTQRSAVMKRLYDLGLVSGDSASSRMVKPELVNLVPQPARGRVDISRRNIIIR